MSEEHKRPWDAEHATTIYAFRTHGKRGKISDVVPWHELTPAAQSALEVELHELLERAPNQAVVPLIRKQIGRDPRVIPYVVDTLRPENEEER